MNLSDAYRYFRKGHMPGGRTFFFAHEALRRAREAVAKHDDARAHYETCAAVRDARREESNAAKHTAQFLASEGGPKYEAAAQAVTVAVAEYDAAERAYNAALKAVAASRLYLPSPAALTWQADATGAAARRGERLAYIDKPESFGLRHVGNVEAESHGGRNAFSNRDSCGWYTDPQGDVFRDGTGLVWGVVYQLPARNGCARFVAGYQFGGVDGGPTLDLGNVYTSESARGLNCSYEGAQGHDDARDAARAADSMAERAAEREREYQTAWAIGRAYDDARQEALEARESIKADLATRRTIRADMARAGVPLESREGSRACGMVRASVSAALATMADARETMRKALEGDGPHGLCVYMDSDAKAAFCEAAGLDSFPA